MKKLMAILSAAAVSVIVFAGASVTTAAAEDDYAIEGGRITVNFDEPLHGELFDFYTEFGPEPYVMDGKVFCWSLAEQKIIFKGNDYEDVEVNVDVTTINPCGKFDSGIYVAARGASDNLDGITAWCINLEHGANQKYVDFKLHRFLDGSYAGVRAEITGIPYAGDTSHIRVVVKDGVLYGFLGYTQNPQITYEIGHESGAVGLRCFYSPNVFDNFTVTAPHNAVDKSELEKYYNLAVERVKENLLEESFEALDAAMAQADAAGTQAETDAAASALSDALNGALTAYTFDELSSLIKTAEDIQNPEGNVYTANSWNSFVAVKNICKTLTEQSSAREISYWYARLQARVSGLISYITGVSE